MGVIQQKGKLIPKTTTPLTKFIRTGEGVLVFAFNLTMLIVPIVSNSLSPEDAVKWAGIVNGLAIISRTGLKVVSEVSKATGIQPEQIGNLTPQVITIDAGGSASNGGAPDVVTEPTDPVVMDPVSGDPSQPSDAEEFASTPLADDDAVDAPASPVLVSGATVDDDAVESGATVDDDAVESGATVDDDAVDVPGPVQATDSPDSTVSDEEEFSDVPPASDDADDGIAPEPASDGGDQTDSPELVGAGASGVPNPIVINGGQES